MKFREVIAKHLPAGQVLPEVPKAKATIRISPIKLTAVQSLFDALPAAKTNASPLTFEDLNQDYGFVLYRTTVSGASGTLRIKELRDYGIVFINDKRAGTLDRRLGQDSLEVVMPKGKVQLDILVENLGRINFGPYLLQNKKGITEKVTLANKELKGWQMFSLPMNDMSKLVAKKITAVADVPVIRSGSFTLQSIGDTYLDMSSWGKGAVWVNGHNLGRYWSIGPQQTLYVPVEWLKKGNNRVTVLELLKPEQKELKGIDTPILDVR